MRPIVPLAVCAACIAGLAWGDSADPPSSPPDPQAVARMQKDLKQLAYYIGEEDGKLGGRTERAILVFAIDEHLGGSAPLSPETLQQKLTEAVERNRQARDQGCPNPTDAAVLACSGGS